MQFCCNINSILANWVVEADSAAPSSNTQRVGSLQAKRPFGPSAAVYSGFLFYGVREKRRAKPSAVAFGAALPLSSNALATDISVCIGLPDALATVLDVCEALPEGQRTLKKNL